MRMGATLACRLHWMHGLARSDVVDVKIRKRNPALPLPRGLEPGALQSVPTPSLPGSARLTVEEARLQRLREDPRYPLVYFDVSIKGQAQGRIEMVLFTDVSPRAAENFRLLCTGEKGVVPQGREGAGNALSFTGSYFYRIIDQFIDQAGANTESAFGGWFMDDPGERARLLLAPPCVSCAGRFAGTTVLPRCRSLRRRTGARARPQGSSVHGKHRTRQQHVPLQHHAGARPASERPLHK